MIKLRSIEKLLNQTVTSIELDLSRTSFPQGFIRFTIKGNFICERAIRKLPLIG